jgi:conjugal transfer pilus assembly protein TraB
VLVRLKHEAILPNRYHANVREAFVLLAAYGDLPAERAYMRAETISLVLNDGTVIQERLKAAAVGEDGMLGLGGKVITKQGAFIANALMVGFLQAAADVLKRGDTYELGLGIASGSGSGGGNPLSSIGLEGSSNAIDRVAKWYVDQADNLFPVIEVQAGRPVDVVLTDELLIPLPQ